MLILIVGILLILYCVTAKRFNVWVAMSFVLLIMGFQEGLPGDYMGYKETFMTGGAEVGAYDSTVKAGEFAHLWTTQVLSKIMSFHMYVLLTSLIQVLAMGLMIRDYAHKNYQYFGVLLIFFTFNIMFIQMKAMRQGYAVDCMVLAYYLLGRRKHLWSLVFMVLAFGFHNSAIVAIPFYMLLWVLMFSRRKVRGPEESLPVVRKGNAGFKVAAWTVIGLLVFYLFKFAVFDRFINPLLIGLQIFEYGDYLSDFGDEGSIAWWILLYHLVVTYFVALYMVNEQNLFKKYMAFLTLLAMFLFIGTFGFGILMRMQAYFLVYSIVAFPNIAAMLRASYGRKAGLAFVLFNMVYVMYTTVRMMLSNDVSNGTGFAPYTFSFLNW